jgi:predicted DNA binding CopG/RHH family protein
MTKTLETPEFKSEAEEAAWWDSHRTKRLPCSKRRRRTALWAAAHWHAALNRRQRRFRLDTADIELAKSLALQRGLRYQTYMKMIIHQYLLKDAGSRPVGSVEP